MYDLVSLGELMLRLSPPGHERLRQASNLQIRLCGAQFNVAADLALLGRKAAFLSALPANELGFLARGHAARYGVDVSHVRMQPDSRMGMIYVDFAGEPRSATHLYDRQGSAASSISPADFNWPQILAGCKLAYTDGIFAGLSDTCRAASLEFIRAARQQGSLVCFDVNYRHTIWNPKNAADFFRSMLPCVEILVTNRSVSESIFGFRGPDEEVLRCYRDEFGCQTICLTSRHMSGARRGKWTSLALHEDSVISASPVEFDIVDRFGTGDAFFAGFLYGYLEQGVPYGLQFGNALCALAHTIEGDVAEVSVEEVLDLLHAGYSHQVKR